MPRLNAVVHAVGCLYLTIIIFDEFHSLTFRSETAVVFYSFQRAERSETVIQSTAS
jgi:hypothetical protein